MIRIGEVLDMMGFGSPEGRHSPEAKPAYADMLRSNRTPSERMMARILYHLGIDAEPQVPLMGWIVDFLDRENRVVIEVDGSVHANQRQQDRERDEAMTRAGYKVIRIANDELPQMMANVMILKRMDAARAKRKAA